MKVTSVSQSSICFSFWFFIGFVCLFVCFSLLKTPGGDPPAMTAGCPWSHLESTSCCLPPHAAVPLSPGSSSTSIPGSSMCSSLCTTSSRPSPTPAAGCVAPWTAVPCWERTGTFFSICTLASFTSWRITFVLSLKTTSQAPFSAGAPATLSAHLRFALMERSQQPLIHLMKHGVLRNVGPWTSL